MIVTFFFPSSVRMCCGEDDRYCCCFRTKGGTIAFWVILPTVCVGLLLMAILIPLSLKDVNFDEVAISYNTLTKTIDTTRIYTEGRYVMDPMVTLLTYKRTLQTIEMTGNGALSCLTKEGLSMALDITAQYRINPAELFDIFNNHGLEVAHASYLTSLSRDTIKDVCPLFTGSDFFNRRADIEVAFKDSLINAYSNSSAYASVVLVQVRNIMHPAAYAQANEAKESVEQEKDRVLSLREQQITDADTRLKTAEFDASILLIQAQAVADANIIAANEKAKVQQTKWSELQSQLLNVFNQLTGVTIDDFIQEYVRYSVIVGRNQTVIGLK